ncbi:MAG: AAA-like domain-containing protein [Eubacteriales bacterium]|nr:AAA-like domain-containing protein [Eubacteriales bacterium]
MGKCFNVTGPCIPAKHYMVDMTERIAQIRKMVDEGDYFTINRARQYGKTTMMALLEKELNEDYLVIWLDFQAFGSASFQNENVFSFAFLQKFLRELKRYRAAEKQRLAKCIEKMQEILETKESDFDLAELFELLVDICENSEKPVVLMIDEVDSASNNQVFLDFLGQLRSYYLERETRGIVTFQSVVLTGVYDIKNLKRKIRPEGDHKTNSPWNIAADFDVDLSLSREGIAGMLREYEADHQTGMNTEEMAELLFDYTSGYPYLVSRLCKLIDEKIGGREKESAWMKEGFLEAVRMLLMESNTLFESLISKLTDYPELERMLKELLFHGKAITYNLTNPVISLAAMFGFVKNQDGKVIPSNRIFDTLLYNHFLSLDEMQSSEIYKASLQDKNLFIHDGRLDMRRILEKFVQHFQELYGERTEGFLEEEGRRYFLLYLRPIINGTGNYYIEARTRSLGRTDIVVDYRGEQFVVETKIWRGNEYNSRGERQVAEYLDDYGLHIGYMLSFSFRKKKQAGIYERRVGDKTIIEAVV